MKKLSSTLPVLPLTDGMPVLLPGGFLRFNVTPHLVEHLLLRSQSRSDNAQAPLKNVENRLQHHADVVAVPLIVPVPKYSSVIEDDEESIPSFDLNCLHTVGTAARVVELIRNGNSWVCILEGRCRVLVRDITSARDDFYVAKVKQLDYFSDGPHARDSTDAASKEEIALQRQIIAGIRSMFAAASSQGGQRSELGARTLQVLKNYGPALTSDLVGSLLTHDTRQRIALLSTVDVVKRLKMVDSLLKRRMAAAGLPPSTSRASSSRTKTAIGNDDDNEEDDDPSGLPPPLSSPTSSNNNNNNEPKMLLQKLKDKHPPQEVLDAANKEVQRLSRMNEHHPSYSTALSYLEILAELPWNKYSNNTNTMPSLAAVRTRLDAEHFGLDKVKERIVQFVAVQSLRGYSRQDSTTARAPVLCLVGPPGVGKTSIARSMAAALNRPFQRISLGGVRDEAEIRGHRRTYIGAMPGRITTALRRAGACDAVFLLDEIDKTGKDARGDPAAALLEVLDAEQNAAFVDTYLGLPIDLSKVVFVATANTVASIPPALLDRMEVVNLSAYTLNEKFGIAERHLVPKILAEHGISKDQLHFPENALKHIIEGYTREAGVRQLALCLAAMCRYVAVELVAEREQKLGNHGALLALPPSAGAANTIQEEQEEQEGDEGTYRSHQHHNSSSSSSWLHPPPREQQHQHLDFDSSRDEQQQQQNGPVLRLLGPGSMQAPNIPNNDAPPSITPMAGSNSETFLQLPLIVDETLIERVLGPLKYHGHDAAQRISSPGVSAGLVYTGAGGAVQYIEALAVGTSSSANALHNSSSPTTGNLTLTGQLGDVLEESAKIALSWTKSHAAALGLPKSGMNWDIHIHLPAGGVPKDGPSAGVTLAVALVSLYTGRCARSDTALTGELTLRGLVLPVGGVKEKVLAAVAAGMRRVILPSRNAEDVKKEIPADLLQQIELIGVERLDQVLEAAFDPPLVLESSEYPSAKL